MTLTDASSRCFDFQRVSCPGSLKMETDPSVSSMILFEDESVDVRYVNGSQLQVSPCGGEFLLVKASDPSLHPLQPRERVRQRTRFTISSYKELMTAALAFRNKYASRPYLPQELVPAEHKTSFSIDSDVMWPEFSSCEAELGPGGETIIRSEEGRATLMLSPSGEEFSIEFQCRLSQFQNHQQSAESFSREADRRASRQQHPGTMYQSTTVVQHHSCFAYAPMWRYPLSLALHHWTTRVSQPKEVAAVGSGYSAQADRKINMSDISSEERRSCLPQALGLTCLSPHRHRWKSKDEDLPAELMKVMWCQGVTYRILSGAVAVMEVSPGDGSVVRSNGVLNTYFTHHRPELQSGRVKEISYHLNNLPPDVVGQAYSICSIVNRASRILTCYDQAKQSLTLPATLSCLQGTIEGRHFSKPAVLEGNLAPVEHQMIVTERQENLSDIVAAEVEKIQRFNFLLENSHLQRGEKACVEQKCPSAEEGTHEPVSESSIAEALQRTSKAIQEIDALVSATTLT
ncbi:uncharacterized protein C5orf34 homolog isoform X1 [Hippoglossus hippoglossus]|uniref:uncharacterized protein C5orf34 homolog isoform X1 n=2 Tax=Hippoglossus hippoglossus TaxID=8267 RepID=UPI00148BCC6F|nr:uncharacterized protein C5orf34 homolog isoform X1 [Hippoglossus hippoglossus]